MRILISNDDGIDAQGLRDMALALSKENDVYVAAPMVQQSAQSQSLTIHTHIKAEERQVPGAKKAWAVGGKPADCTKIGIYLMDQLGEPADIVFTGINHGSNMGWDTLYSGTIGAALEGNLSGRPSVAMSVASHDPKYGFEVACDYACRLAKAFREAMEEAKKTPVLSNYGKPVYCPRSAMGHITSQFGYLEKYRYRTISVNVPDIPKDKILGIKKASIGPRDYTSWVFEGQEEDGSIYYEYVGDPIDATPGELYEFGPLGDDADSYLLAKGWITLTVVAHDLTDFSRQDLALSDLGLSEI